MCIVVFEKMRLNALHSLSLKENAIESTLGFKISIELSEFPITGYEISHMTVFEFSGFDYVKVLDT